MNKSSSYSQAAAKFNLQAYPQKVLKYAFIHVRNPKQKQIKKKKPGDFGHTQRSCPRNPTTFVKTKKLSVQNVQSSRGKEVASASQIKKALCPLRAKF